MAQMAHDAPSGKAADGCAKSVNESIGDMVNTGEKFYSLEDVVVARMNGIVD